MSIHLPHERQRRALGAYITLAIVMATLTVAFFRIQVLGSSTWELRAESNRIRQLPIPNARGIIYDRNGTILADNVPGYAITLLPGPLDSARATLERMSDYVGISEAQIERVISSRWEIVKRPNYFSRFSYQTILLLNWPAINTSRSPSLSMSTRRMS